LLVYSLDDSLVFDPFELDMETTPQSVLKALYNKEYVKALIMSLRLSEQDIITKVFEGIPVNEIQLIVQSIPVTYLLRLLKFIESHVENSPHLEFHLLWCTYIFNCHGKYLKDNSNIFGSVMRGIKKNITIKYEDLATLCNENYYSLIYLANQKPSQNMDISDNSLNTSSLHQLQPSEQEMIENDSFFEQQNQLISLDKAMEVADLALKKKTKSKK